MGNSLLVALLTAGQTDRSVYLSEGERCDFYTGEKYSGGRRYPITPAPDSIPIYVRYGSIIPWTKPVPYVDRDTVFELVLCCYGVGSCTLYEDDGVPFDFENGKANPISPPSG